MASKTPKLEAAEVGSFIHLGLRPRLAGDDRHIEVLLGDVAGEHFSELTSHADAAALQRMAFLRRCEGFVLVVDAIALHGPKGPRLDAELARMAGRLIDVLGENVRRDVPIAVILSKTDAVPELPRDAVALREHLQRRAPRLTTALRRATSEQIPHELFAVAAIPQTGQPFGVQECFGYLLGHADRRARWPRWIPPIPEAPVSSFLAMRAWRDAP